VKFDKFIFEYYNLISKFSFYIVYRKMGIVPFLLVDY